MAKNGMTHTDDPEIAELREEVQRLREAQEKRDGKDGDPEHKEDRPD